MTLSWQLSKDVDVVSAEWIELWRARQSDHPFSHPDYLRCWLRSFLESRGIEIHLGYDAHEKCAAILPFTVSELKNVVTRRELMGAHPTLYDSMKILFDPTFENEVLEKLSELQSARGGLFDFPYLTEQQSVFKRLPHTRTIFTDKVPRIELSGDWNWYLRDYLDRKNKAEVVRIFNRANEAGTVVLSAAGPKEIPAFLRMHVVQWESQGQRSIFERAAYADFFAYLMEDFSAHCRFDKLLIGDSVVAYHFGFCANRTFYYVTPTYALEHKKLSPGRLLLASLIKDTIEKGFASFVMGRGDESYKYQWASQEETVYRQAGTANKLLALLQKNPMCGRFFFP